MAGKVVSFWGLNKRACDVSHENRVNIESLLGQLRVLLEENYKTLRLPSNSNEILEICLRRRQFDLNKAADQVHAFLKLVYDMNEAHEDNMYFLPSIHKTYCHDSFGMVLLKQRDSKGRAVICINYAALKPQEFCLDKVTTCGIMMLNELTRMSLDVQCNGVVYVHNLKGFQFGHAKGFNFKRVQVLSRYVQGAVPVTFKAFHMINSPRIFGYTYNLLIRPLLKSKIRSRVSCEKTVTKRFIDELKVQNSIVHFHGSDLTDFYEDVNREILPDILGGDLPIEECADIEFTNYLCSQDSYYKELLQHESAE